MEIPRHSLISPRILILNLLINFVFRVPLPCCCLKILLNHPQIITMCSDVINTRFMLRSLISKLKEKVIDFYVPCSWRLLESINGFPPMTYLIFLSGNFEILWLWYKDVFLQISIQKCCNNIDICLDLILQPWPTTIGLRNISTWENVSS